MPFTLRPYQNETIAALHAHICGKESNPCVVLPTGAGKSVVMAAMIRQWREQAPWVRGCILAHRKELVEQNAAKLQAVYPESKIGIFAAGLKRRDYDAQILFASIDSIYRRAGEFEPFDFLFVDEAHRIPFSGEGKYRTFIAGCKKFNSALRVIGWTATPYRMNGGSLCHKDHILHEICYDAKITDLIRDSYLCNLRSKVGESQPNLDGVRRNHGGDYVVKSLAESTNRDDVVSAAVAEAIRIMQAEKRQSAVLFCVNIEHCKRVSEELRRYGVYAPYLVSKTKREDRDRMIADFKANRIRAICNVNVLTEGFDAPQVDTIVLLRPTLSPGLYSQMVGRGLRLHDSKAYCLVLDFAGCIEEHGPIDLLGGAPVVMATCPECRESFSRALRECPHCGWKIPKQEIDRLDRVERERRMHGDKASKKSILSGEPEIAKVDSVFVSRHRKHGAPDSIRVQYRCGLSMFREWICLDHEGYAGQKAQAWWRARFGKGARVTVGDALQDLFLGQSLLEWTKTITVKRNGRYTEVIAYNQPLPEATE